MRYVGVDGCKAGWFSVELDENGNPDFEVHNTFELLWNHYNGATLILVDIPIGLPHGPLERGCDLQARQCLGQPRSSSVFPVPCREALRAETYNEAKVINKGITNRGISLPAWHIMKKIFEVDNLLQQNEHVRQVVREVHPEVLFWALNSRQSMHYYKRKPAGFSERLRLLEVYYPNAADVIVAVNLPGVARDDVVDALSAAVTAYRSEGNLQRIPETPQYDLTGLPIEMVFWDGEM